MTHVLAIGGSFITVFSTIASVWDLGTGLLHKNLATGSSSFPTFLHWLAHLFNKLMVLWSALGNSHEQSRHGPALWSSQSDGLANDLMKKYTVKTVVRTTIKGTEVLGGRVRRSGRSGKVSLKRTFHRRCARWKGANYGKVESVFYKVTYKN